MLVELSSEEDLLSALSELERGRAIRSKFVVFVADVLRMEVIGVHERGDRLGASLGMAGVTSSVSKIDATFVSFGSSSFSLATATFHVLLATKISLLQTYLFSPYHRCRTTREILFARCRPL